MAFILSILNGLTTFSKSQVTDDVTDRLHYKLTSGLLVAFAILVSFKQFGGKPIDCLIPHVTDSWDGMEDYAENYCFAQSTYYLRTSEQVKYGDKSLVEKDRAVSYFQWVPFFLVISAAGFQIPYMLWTFLASHSGIRIHDIVGEARDRKNMEGPQKRETIKCLRIHLENALRFHRRLERKKYLPHKKLRCLNFPYSACYVTVTYIFVKFLYLINICVQFHVLNRFLTTGSPYDWYGLGVMSDIIHGKSWEQTGAFPRSTLCNFELRGTGNVNQHTLQCVLLINMFNEKIFILLWFWYQILTVLSICSTTYWIFATFFPCINKGFINRHLVLSNMPYDPIASRKDVLTFTKCYLHADGIFVIRMVEINAGVIFGSDLVCALWKSYYSIEEAVVKQVSDPGYNPSIASAPPLPIYDPDQKNGVFSRTKSHDPKLLEEGRTSPKLKFWDENIKEYSVHEESEDDNDDEGGGSSRGGEDGPFLGEDKGSKSAKGEKSDRIGKLGGLGERGAPLRSKYNYRQRQGNLVDGDDPLSVRRDLQDMKKSTPSHSTFNQSHNRHNRRF